YRIDGALHDVLALPANMGPSVISRIKVLAGMDSVERRKPQDGQIGMEVEGRPLDIRVSTTTTIWGEKGVMRLLDKNRSLFRLGELGMPEVAHDRFSRLIRSPFGMVICAGPTGSGKTTTLYAALTGHLVLTSIHATDAAGALARFLDLGIEPFLVASSVIGVVGQRLVRRICRSCRAPYTPSPEEMNFYRESGGAPKDLFWQGEG